MAGQCPLRNDADLTSVCPKACPPLQHVTLQVVRTIPAGAEATASYLGELVLAPLKWRREWLHGSYGFTCECERCTVGTARG